MFLQDFADKIFHVHVKESVRQLNGRNGRLGSHLPWADPRRGWDFVTAGHGDVQWEPIFRTLNAIGYQGPTSVEWEDAGMDRLDRRARRPSRWSRNSPPSRRPRPPSTPPSPPADPAHGHNKPTTEEPHDKRPTRPPSWCAAAGTGTSPSRPPSCSSRT